MLSTLQRVKIQSSYPKEYVFCKHVMIRDGPWVLNELNVVDPDSCIGSIAKVSIDTRFGGTLGLPLEKN